MDQKGIIDIQGFRMEYRIEGEGTPALVIGGAVYYPRTFLGNIRQYLQLVFIDHRGFVAPPGGEQRDSDFDLDILLSDIERIREVLHLKQFVVIGHSGNAFLALEYAKKYLQNVSHVVMIGASPDYSAATTKAREDHALNHMTAERRAAFEASMAQLPMRIATEPDRRFAHMCLCAGPLSWYDPTFDATDLWEGVYTNMPAIDYIWGRVFRDIDINKGLDQLNKPVLLVLGEYDYLTGTPFLWESIRPLFKNLTVAIFEKSAHTPQLEEAERFNETLINWLLKTSPTVV